ncbi:hypothetical protein OEZ86_011516 [Tetradesmus obliquus]|nr:hypothetical protein OEZ86_011516 [Tetradesmus obliquus]
MDDLDGLSSDEPPALEAHTDSEQDSDDEYGAAVGGGHAADSNRSVGSTTSSSMRPGMPTSSTQPSQRLPSTFAPQGGSRGSSSHNSMMDGLNRNSRIWQVPEGDDPHEHALGPAPDDEEHHAAFQMASLQFMPGLLGAAGGQMLLSMPMPAALASMHHSGRSSAPEPMFVPGGGTSGPPPFQGMLGSVFPLAMVGTPPSGSLFGTPPNGSRPRLIARRHARLHDANSSSSAAAQLPDSFHYDSDDVPELVAASYEFSDDASEESSIAPLLSSEGDDDDDELPPDLDDPDASDSSSENDLAGMPELECGTEDELSSSGKLSVSDDALPSLVGSSGGDEPPALESAEDEAGLWAGGSSGGESDEESDAPPGLVDCDSEVDSMPGLEAASDAEGQHAPAARQGVAAAAARLSNIVRPAAGTATNSSSSGFRRGFLGQPLQQFSWTAEEQQAQQQQLEAQQQLRREQQQLIDANPRLRAGQTVSSDDDDDGDGSHGWETASDQDAEHVEARRHARERSVSEQWTDEEEDEDEDDDGEDDEDDDDEDDDDAACNCPQCRRMRARAELQRGINDSISRGGPGSAGHPTPDWSADLAQTLLESLMGSSSSMQRSRQEPAAGAAAAVAGSSSSAAAAAAPAVPPGLMAPADAQQLVQQVGQALSDAAFTQQLLAGLPGVDPGHSSVKDALRLLQGKAWAPANQATQEADRYPGMAPMGRDLQPLMKRSMVAYEQRVFSVNAQQAARLVARWRHH